MNTSLMRAVACRRVLVSIFSCLLVAAANAAPAADSLTSSAARAIIAEVRVTPAPDGSVPSGQLLSQDVLKTFKSSLRKDIQQALLEIYAADPAFMLAYRESTAPLSDGIVGPITLSWLNRFWFAFNMVPTGNLTNASVQSLLHFSATVKAHPEWKTDLLSADLGRWIDVQDHADKARYYQVRLAGTERQIRAMLKLYHDDTNHGEVAFDQDRGLLTIYSYGLTADDFKLLLAKSQIVDKLSALQDTTYANKPLFDAAVGDALKDLNGHLHAYLPMIEQVAHQNSYKLSAQSIQTLKSGKEVPEDVLAALQTMHDVYADQDAFTEAIIEATSELDKVDVSPYMQSIIKAAEIGNSYVLTENGLKALKADSKAASVPPVILDMLKGLQGLAYPQRSLFDKAVLARLRAALGACPSNAQNSAIESRKIGADLMQELKASVGASLFEQLEKLWNGGACDADQLIAMNQQIEALYMPYRPSITQSARKKPLYDPNKRIVWDGNFCGCALDQFAGDVYGFYPFWFAGQKQQINFSTLSRIGYYGVSFDDSGVLRQANDGREISATLLNGDSTQLDFIKVAHKYRTQIDWVINRNDWRSWNKMGKEKKEQVFDRLTASIVHLLAPIKESAERGISLRLGKARRNAAHGDGVTLYFDNYPTDEVSVAAFTRFVGQLEAGLRNASSGYTVNIMLRHSVLGKGIYEYRNLMALINASEASARNGFLDSKPQDTWLRYLVLIEEPTTDSKKRLRLELEAALHGADREKVLRQVIPVITFDQDNWQQLEDDIIYFKDNFGGIGFWPLNVDAASASAAPHAPVVDFTGIQHCDVSKDINQCLIDHYQENPGVQANVVCKFVCENRWAFRWAWDLCLLLLLGFGVLHWRSCCWRERMIRYHYIPLIGSAAGTAILGLALLFCDPFLQQISHGYMIPIFLVIFIFVLIGWYQYQLKARDEQP